MNYVKKSWTKINEQLNQIVELYTKIETQKLLLKNEYYKTLYGKSKNRTLIKENPKLYKSIYFHTSILEKVMREQRKYKGCYNFSYRIKFIVERNCDISSLKCKCGRTYTWNENCRYCPEIKKTWLGKAHTKKTKKQQRLSAITYIEKQHGQIQPRYNINSIPIIERFGNENNYNFQHAENGGEYYIKELGYFLDAYDVEKNIVLEIDESYHYKNNKLRKKDTIRQHEIEKILNCKFIRKKI